MFYQQKLQGLTNFYDIMMIVIQIISYRGITSGYDCKINDRALICVCGIGLNP